MMVAIQFESNSMEISGSCSIVVTAKTKDAILFCIKNKTEGIADC